MNYQKYALAFVITAAIFGTAFYIANRLDARRISDIRTTQEAVATDILSLETQFDLLGSIDCATLPDTPILSEELASLASRLSVAEQNLGSNNVEVLALKKQYTLLELKDYVLMRQITQKCPKFKPVYVLYFYSNQGDCPQCTAMGDVLTYLRQEYPALRVYSFDYHLDLSALRTLLTLRKIDAEKGLPAFAVNNRAAVYGVKDLEETTKLIPELKTLATSTPSSQ